MTKVRVNEAQAAIRGPGWINDIPFDEIEWVDKDDQPIKLTSAQEALRRKWGATGRRNIDFVNIVLTLPPKTVRSLMKWKRGGGPEF